MSARMSVNLIRDEVTPRLGRGIVTGPARNRLFVWFQGVRDEAADRAPKDTRDLANSLQVFEGTSDPLRSGGIRSNSRKFWFVHGRYAVPAPPRRRSEPHFPPPNQSLRGWSTRHGIPVFLVQQAIARRGTPIIPFLAEAVEGRLGSLQSALDDAAQDIARDFNA